MGSGVKGLADLSDVWQHIQRLGSVECGYWEVDTTICGVMKSGARGCQDWAERSQLAI